MQARRTNDILRPGIQFGTDNWYPTDELIDAQIWTRNWREEPVSWTLDHTPGNATRTLRDTQGNTTRNTVPGEWPMTPNVREWREETGRAININRTRRQNQGEAHWANQQLGGGEFLVRAPPGYEIQYESDHSSDNEEDLPELWLPGTWHDRGTINLRWRGNFNTAIEWYGLETRSVEVGIPIRIRLSDFAYGRTLVDELLEYNPFAEL